MGERGERGRDGGKGEGGGREREGEWEREERVETEGERVSKYVGVLRPLNHYGYISAGDRQTEWED